MPTTSPQIPPLVFCGTPALYSELEQPDRTLKDFNLVLISLDTLRADRLGCYGYPRPVSPSIDALAKESCLFECVYAHAPYTHASHASLFTSLY
ncbi:MAG: sulfatase-like hydrolase/transferase, partial [Planctomycetes bacterium]|nr:sulfatase-like hydrolase/transferase [Planctomycetota bacterium]